MQAIQGIYDNGTIKLDRKAPSNKARVIVVFAEEESRKKMSVDDALKILHKHAGSMKNDIDFEEERDEYLNEKYGSIN